MVPIYDSLVVRTVGKVLVPFIQIFGIYVVFHGAKSPGGGFQGGAILAASFILTRFTGGPEGREPYLPGLSALRIGAVGVLLYVLVGAVPLFYGAAFLDYGAVAPAGSSVAHARALGIELVETGVAIAVCGIMVSIFDDLAPGERSTGRRRGQASDA